MMSIIDAAKKLFGAKEDPYVETFSPEIEEAARWMCAQKGVDPDEMLKFICDDEPRWHRYARELRHELLADRHERLKGEALAKIRSGILPGNLARDAEL